LGFYIKQGIQDKKKKRKKEKVTFIEGVLKAFESPT
jgi:hypothetical protein